jgi:nicotinate-nucleotide adenylyltransferase
VTDDTQPLGIMGGTFDPVHYGHLRCAEEARRKLGLKTVHLLPAGTPPHRQAPVASAAQRLAMLEQALSEFPRLEIDGRETRRAGPSYMVETLLEMRVEFPNRPILLMLGQDAANGLHGWHRWRRLFGLAHIVILERPGTRAHYDPDVAQEIEDRVSAEPDALFGCKAGRVLYLDVGRHDISATVIKELIRQGRSPGGMMPAAELEYIREHGIYMGGTGAAA